MFGIFTFIIQGQVNYCSLYLSDMFSRTKDLEMKLSAPRETERAYGVVQKDSIGVSVVWIRAFDSMRWVSSGYCHLLRVVWSVVLGYAVSISGRLPREREKEKR